MAKKKEAVKEEEEKEEEVVVAKKSKSKKSEKSKGLGIDKIESSLSKRADAYLMDEVKKRMQQSQAAMGQLGQGGKGVQNSDIEVE